MTQSRGRPPPTEASHHIERADAALETLMPIVRREAAKLKRALPPNVAFDEIQQAARIAAWEAIRAFDGRGNLSAFAAQRIRQRLIDFQRDSHPAGRSGKKIVPVSANDAAEMVASRDDPAAEVERAHEFEAQMKKLAPGARSAIENALAGKPATHTSAAKVSALLDGKKARVSAAFDPHAVMIRVGVPVPAMASPSRQNKSEALIARMPAGSSVILATTAAHTLVRAMREQKIRYTLRKRSDTTAEVWREPTTEQLKGK